MRLRIIVAVTISTFIIGFVLLYRELFTKHKKKIELPWKIEYMQEERKEGGVVSAEFDQSHMATVECDGTRIPYQEGMKCVDGDEKLCEPYPYRMLAFFDDADGYLSRIKGDGSYECSASAYYGACEEAWLEPWKKLRKGAENLTECPVDEDAYPLIGRCYRSIKQTGGAIDKANRYIEINDLKCEK